MKTENSTSDGSGLSVFLKIILKKTSNMSYTERGKYVTLLCHEAENGGRITRDVIDKIGGFSPRIFEKFTEREGCFYSIK